MHRIDHETATSDHKFTEGNPTIPVPATVVTDDWLNAVQEELVAVITGAGLELEKSDNTQLWQAITTAVDNARPGLATTKNPGLVQIGDGLAITPQGLLSVLIASTSQAGLVKPRYGLKIGADGSLDVDFGDMPTDKFEALLKSIRVPIWLTKPLTIYVATTGSDTLDDGRGLSAEKPFKTLQAAVNYVSDTYNLSNYNITISLEPGIYKETTTNLPKYNSVTGTISIRGNRSNKYNTVIHNISLSNSVNYSFYNLTIKARSADTFGYCVYITSGTVNAFDVKLDASEAIIGNGDLYCVRVENSGVFKVWATSGPDVPNGLLCTLGKTMRGVLFAQYGGSIQYAADISVEGDSVLSRGFCAVSVLGLISRVLSSLANPGRMPTVTSTGTVAGPRYYAKTNGIIDSNGGGAEFYPGSESGRVNTGGQYA